MLFQSPRSIVILTGAIFTASALTLTAEAAIGVNFVGGNNGGAPTSLAPGDVAGLADIAQGNFNNVAGNTGTAIALVDDAGLPSGVTLTFNGAGTWGTGLGAGTPNQSLLNGYVDGTDNGSNTYTFSGLAAGSYKFVIYSLPDNTDGRDESLAITTGVVNTGPSTYFLSADPGAGFNTNGFVRATSTTAPGAGNQNVNSLPDATGNYVQFDSVTPVSGAVTITGTSLNFRNFSNGIQVIPVPEPSAALAILSGASLLLGLRRRKQSGV